jgi:putative endonuclease
VYILCNKRNGTLYIGVTSDLIKRVYEHRNNIIDGFTNKYNIHNLVWYEIHENVQQAIIREKQIKK